jgi:hypothetical protein
MDRVAFVTICWFVFWTGAGALLGRFLEVPGTFTVAGFIFALWRCSLGRGFCRNRSTAGWTTDGAGSKTPPRGRRLSLEAPVGR